MLLAFRALGSRCRVLTAVNPVGSRIVNRLRTFSAYYSGEATTTKTRARVCRRSISVVMASHSQQGDTSDNQLVICKYKKYRPLSFLPQNWNNVASSTLLYPSPFPTIYHTCTVHATDIHLAFDNVQRLKEWIKQKDQRYCTDRSI